MSDNFEPIMYYDRTCSSCFKVLLFLLDSGLIGHFDQQEFTPGGAREQRIRDELRPHLGKASFPTVQYAPGKYLSGSEKIIEHYARAWKVEPEALRTYSLYAETHSPKALSVRRADEELKERQNEYAASMPQAWSSDMCTD